MNIIDLSHTIVPEKEEYGCVLDVKNIEEVFTKYKRAPDAWYVIGRIEMNTHCGTHIEAPYHHDKDGLDIASLPMECLVGLATCIDLRQRSFWPRADPSRRLLSFSRQEPLMKKYSNNGGISTLCRDASVL